ncbi:ACT domain-containing protein ACR2-like isoform X1 [Salvia splendens]|uniref:ACT domain-containing protein ACR2-like isoform X1 n=1 Tax=Salvia splendens TaxID=180675 RepID=UPI001C26FBC9|nr:ACT domain-containing protein ACR2-like isoform X1 [Salvia splendens]XP_042001672.1 ACT domain-containing protein ACR2-like isoform X1 [Salvia splendens]XP_042001673.1 ACT domain-containing protein ACR2-like isoform X1 [Salvia splendens]
MHPSLFVKVREGVLILFCAVFHVKNELGFKVTDQRVINYIQQAVSAGKASSPKTVSRGEAQAIEMTGKNRPGLFSEISAALADMGCNIVEAHAWSHNALLACIAYISDQSVDTPIDDHRLHAIEDHLTTVLRATTATEEDSAASHQEVKPAAGLPKGKLSSTTRVERRLHQLMLSVRDFDSPTSSRRTSVSIERCIEKGYSIVTIQCKDRRRLMFDTVCTLIDMQYVIFHASVDACRGLRLCIPSIHKHAFPFLIYTHFKSLTRNAPQEYFVRHADGRAFNTESEKDRVIKCLEAAIERRVCEVWLELQLFKCQTFLCH